MINESHSPHDSAQASRQRPSRHYRVVITLIAVVCAPVEAQDAIWSFSIETGYAELNMAAVQMDNENDVRGWGANGVPLPPFESIRPIIFTSARVVYNFGYDVGVSVSVVNYAKHIATAYQPEVINEDGSWLELERDIGSTDAQLGVLLYLPNGIGGFRTYLEIIAGWAWATAGAKAAGQTLLVISGDSTVTTVNSIETTAQYSRSTNFAAVAIGASKQVFGPLAINLNFRYKSGPIGQMDGTITSFGETSDITSFVEFDYSGWFLSLGLALEF